VNTLAGSARVINGRTADALPKSATKPRRIILAPLAKVS